MEVLAVTIEPEKKTNNTRLRKSHKQIDGEMGVQAGAQWAEYGEEGVALRNYSIQGMEWVLKIL